ncbi:MAG: hypothetical protein ACLQE9_06515 [Roseiarcus sp.]
MREEQQQPARRVKSRSRSSRGDRAWPTLIVVGLQLYSIVTGAITGQACFGWQIRNDCIPWSWDNYFLFILPVSIFIWIFLTLFLRILWRHFKRQGLSDEDVDAELWGTKRVSFKDMVFAAEVGFWLPLLMVASLLGAALLWFNVIAVRTGATPAYAPQPEVALRSLGPDGRSSQPGHLVMTRAEILPPLLRDGQPVPQGRPRLVLAFESRLPVEAVLRSFRIALYTAAGDRVPTSRNALGDDLPLHAWAPPRGGYELEAEVGGQPQILQVCAAIVDRASRVDRERSFLILSGARFVPAVPDSEARFEQQYACPD